MALRWIEGFEGATSADEVHERIYETATNANLNPEDGASESATGEAVSGYQSVLTTNPLVGSPENSWIIGLAFRSDSFNDFEQGDIPFIALENDDGEQIRLEWTVINKTKPNGNTYRLRVMRGATELATSVNQWLIDNNDTSGWIYFEFKFTIDDASGSFEARYQHMNKPSLNPGGAPTAVTWDASTSSIDTQEQVTTGANRFTVSMTTGSSSHRVAFDDIYVCDSTGSKNNDYLGKIIIENQDVSGDGDTTDWTLATATSTEDAWNEPTTGIEDDDRLTSDAISQVHLATVGALSTIPAGASIVGVRQDIHCRMETTGDLDIAHMMRKTTGTPAETNVGTALNVDSTAYEASAVVLEDDPNTATDWDRADLDSYQHGVRNDG